MYLCRDEQRFVSFDNAKVRQESHENKKSKEILFELLRHAIRFATKGK
jgi:hypothetical protein